MPFGILLASAGQSGPTSVSAQGGGDNDLQLELRIGQLRLQAGTGGRLTFGNPGLPDGVHGVVIGHLDR